MRRLLFLTLLVGSLTSAPAFADQILFLSPNTGSGDNFGISHPVAQTRRQYRISFSSVIWLPPRIPSGRRWGPVA